MGLLPLTGLLFILYDIPMTSCDFDAHQKSYIAQDLIIYLLWAGLELPTWNPTCSSQRFAADAPFHEQLYPASLTERPQRISLLAKCKKMGLLLSTAQVLFSSIWQYDRGLGYWQWNSWQHWYTAISFRTYVCFCFLLCFYCLCKCLVCLSITLMDNNFRSSDLMVA